MPVETLTTEQLNLHPLDVLEEVLSAHDRECERVSETDLFLEISGRWCDYRLYFHWQEELDALHFSCIFETRITGDRSAEVHRLLALINERLWLGHFDLATPEGTLSFRYTMLQRGAGPVSIEQYEDLLDVAINDSDCYFPAFQFVLWGGKSAEDALDAAMIEVAGTA